MDFRVGDVIQVQSNQVGQAPRNGTVKEVISEDHTELRVAWEDGHESNYFPAGGMVRIVERASG